MGTHREEDVHSLEVPALSSHHGRKMLNSGALQHFSSGGLLWVPSRETEVMVSDKGRAGSIQLEMGEPRFISQDAQKTMRQTLLWVVLTSESNSKSA